MTMNTVLAVSLGLRLLQGSAGHPLGELSASGTVLLWTVPASVLHVAGWHLVLAGSAGNDVTGAVVRRNGTRVCSVVGTITEGGCFAVTGCGVGETVLCP